MFDVPACSQFAALALVAPVEFLLDVGEEFVKANPRKVAKVTLGQILDTAMKASEAKLKEIMEQHDVDDVMPGLGITYGEIVKKELECLVRLEKVQLQLANVEVTSTPLTGYSASADLPTAKRETIMAL